MPFGPIYTVTLSQRARQHMMLVIGCICVVTIAIPIMIYFVDVTIRIIILLAAAQPAYVCYRILSGPRRIEVFANHQLRMTDWLGRTLDACLEDITSVARESKVLIITLNGKDYYTMSDLSGLSQFLDDVKDRARHLELEGL